MGSTYRQDEEIAQAQGFLQNTIKEWTDHLTAQLCAFAAGGCEYATMPSVDEIETSVYELVTELFHEEIKGARRSLENNNCTDDEIYTPESEKRRVEEFRALHTARNLQQRDSALARLIAQEGVAL